MVTIRRWTGREAKALRTALRMSSREFAEHLGVSHRTVSKWEAGGENISPVPDSKAILDTALSRAGHEAAARFTLLITPVKSKDPGGETSGGEERGAVSRHPRDGKLMAPIAAGIFLSGHALEPVWLADYYIDVTPVTNAEYANFVAATEHQPPSHWRDGECPHKLDDHPVVFVTHHDATAYATWAEKRLPTAHEWEKAARGKHGATYPWGHRETWAKCNVRESQVGGTTPVSRYHSGTSPYGVYDMAGNVWEWCSTATEPGRFVLRGSAFTSTLPLAAGAATNDAAALMSDDDTGFRCAAAPWTSTPLTEPVQDRSAMMPQPAEPDHRLRVAICGSRSTGCDSELIQQTIRALARLVFRAGWTVSHGPVGVGIEVMTYIADHYQPPGFNTAVGRFGHRNVVADADYVIAVGGATGTADELDFAAVMGKRIIAFGASGGSASRFAEQAAADPELQAWIPPDDVAALRTCVDGEAFARILARLLTNEQGDHQ